MGDRPQRARDQLDQTDKALAAALTTVAAVAVAAALLLPTVAGAALWRAGRRWLGRVEYALLAAAGAAGAALLGGERLLGYLTWLWQVATWDDPWKGVPWLVLLVLSLLVGGVLGVADRSGLLGLVSPRRKKTTDEESVVPSEDERERVSIVATPGQALLADPDQHSLDEQDRGIVGQRAFPIGRDRKGQPVMLSEAELKAHAMLIGTTGCGKTETIKNLAGNLLDLGWDGIILDLKEDIGGDESLRGFCRAYATTHARPYQEMALTDLTGNHWFNVLGGLPPDEALDTMLSLQTFEAPHYRALNEKLLGQLTRLVYDAHELDPERFPQPTVYDIGKMLNRNIGTATRKLRAFVQEHHPNRGEEDFAALDGNDQDMVGAASGLGARLTGIYESEAGKTLLTKSSPDRREIDVTAEGLCYIGLNTQAKPYAARVVSAAVLQRLSVLSGQRNSGIDPTGGRPKFLIVDESNWIDRTIVQNLVSRSRGAKISLVLATQGPKDWDGGEGDANTGWDSLTQNISTAIIMRQNNPLAAEVCAEYLGKRERYDVSHRMEEDELVEGAGTVRTRLGYNVEPEELRGLRSGEAILRTSDPKQRLEWVKVDRRDPRQVITKPPAPR